MSSVKSKGFNQRTKQYIAVVDSFIQGIPCCIGVIDYENVPPFKGPISRCPSDIDYYGYESMDYDVLDRKGYLAKWLLEKLTEKDERNIETDVSYYFEELEKNYDGY